MNSLLSMYTHRFMVKTTTLLFLKVVLLLFPLTIVATPKEEIDSLLNVLNEEISKQDQVDTYNKLALAYGLLDSAHVAQYTKEAIRISKSINYHKGTSDAYFHIATATYRKDDYPTGLQLYKKALHYAHEGNYTSGIMSIHANMGILHFRKGDYYKGLNELNIALAAQDETCTDADVLRTHGNLGVGLVYLGKYNQALAHFLKAGELAKKTNKQGLLASTYNNIASIYMNLSEYQKSLDYLFKSLVIKEELSNERGIAASYNNIGSNYVNLGKLDDALAYYEKALEIRTRLKDKRGIMRSFGGLSNAYKEMNQLNTSKSYLDKAIAISKEIGANAKLVEYTIDISEILFIQKKYKQAQQKLLSVIEIAKKYGYLPELRTTNLWLSKIHNQLKNYKQAYDYHVTYTALNDSLKGKEVATEIAELEAEYQYELSQDSLIFSKEKQKLEFEAELEEKDFEQKISHSALVILILLLGAISIIFVEKQRNNKKLQQTNMALQLANDAMNKAQLKIHSSINYAKRIQNAVLPNLELFSQALSDYFVLFLPKDGVSGDFYWIADLKKECNKVILAAVDCTGHGVPGAFMSMVGNNLLQYIVKETGIHQADLILDKLHIEVRQTLKQNKTNINDGMDIALLVIDYERKILEFAGAKNSLVYIQHNKLFRIKGSNLTIGGE